jgi:uncharacterized protein YjbJ (UPF0337 family)
MKPSTHDGTAGRWHRLKGRIKEFAGKITRDPGLEAEGKSERFGGKVQEKIGAIKKVVGK